MAISSLFNDPYGDDYMRQRFEQEKRRAYEQVRDMQNNSLSQLGKGFASDYEKQAPKPVPQPEPNKVLLLLGEEA